MASAMWSITFAFWLFSLTKSLHEDRANDTDFDVIITPPLFQSGRVAQKKNVFSDGAMLRCISI